MRRRFTIFETFGEIIDGLPDQRSREQLSYAILNYGLNEVEPELEYPLNLIFYSLRGDIDNSANARSRNRGGRPKTPVYDNEKPGFSKYENGGFEEPETGVAKNESQKPKPKYIDRDIDIGIDKDIGIGTSPQKQNKFVKPTVEEVREYCAQKGYNVDAERFVAHYESNGWMVGKNHMKSWKAATVTWDSRANSKKEVKSYDKYNR